jgi:hypothetical protein
MFYFGSGKEKSPSPLNFDEIIARAPHLDLDVSVPGVLPDRRLHMTRLTIIDAFNVVRLEYEIIPLNEPPSPESAEVSRAYGPWGWMVGGRDDRGTVYDDHGGTYGVPPNGLVADGDRDLFPAPHQTRPGWKSPSTSARLTCLIRSTPSRLTCPYVPRLQIANATTAHNKRDGHSEECGLQKGRASAGQRLVVHYR